MKTKATVVFVIAAMIAFFYWLPEPQRSKSNSHTAPPSEVEVSSFNYHFVIRNVRFYDGYNLIENTDVLVENRRIAQVGKNIENKKDYRELDAAGQTLIPGLVDAHTHTWGNALKQALNFGVTTELDMFTLPASSNPHQGLRDDLSNVEQADLFSATILATAPKGHGTEYGFEIPVLNSVDQVTPFVRARIDDGADYIKAVYLSTGSERQYYPSISKAILARLIEEAHQHQKLLVVHVDNLISATEAIELGADGIIHSFMDKVVDQAFIDLMLSNKAFIVPTLSVQASVAGVNGAHLFSEAEVIQTFLSIEQRQQLNAAFQDYGIPKTAYQVAEKSVGLLAKAGVPILAGSDAPNPGTAHGVTLHGELQLLVEAGLTPEQAIHSATGAASKIFPIGLRGTLKTGAPASMILLSGNPFVDISATQSISAIWKNGFQFSRTLAADELAAEKPLAASLISDFNHSDHETKIGAGINPTTDQIAGGQSQVLVSLVDKSASEMDTALQVTGEVKAGFAYSWSGISFLPGKSYSEGANLTAISSISFDAKGSERFKQITIMIFQQGSYQPSTQQITLSDSWQSYQVELAAFERVDFNRISNISLVAAGAQGPFEFTIDNLAFE